VPREHPPPADGLQDLVPEKREEVVGAERGVVAAQLQHRAAAALPALHARPPEITRRSSTTSSSRTTSSIVSRSRPGTTGTVPGRSPSPASTSFTRRRPASSTSFPWLRRITRITGHYTGQRGVAATGPAATGPAIGRLDKGRPGHPMLGRGDRARR